MPSSLQHRLQGRANRHARSRRFDYHDGDRQTFGPGLSRPWSLKDKRNRPIRVSGWISFGSSEGWEPGCWQLKTWLAHPPTPSKAQQWVRITHYISTNIKDGSSDGQIQESIYLGKAWYCKVDQIWGLDLHSRETSYSLLLQTFDKKWMVCWPWTAMWSPWAPRQSSSR